MRGSFFCHYALQEWSWNILSQLFWSIRTSEERLRAAGVDGLCRHYMSVTFWVYSPDTLFYTITLCSPRLHSIFNFSTFFLNVSTFFSKFYLDFRFLLNISTPFIPTFWLFHETFRHLTLFSTFSSTSPLFSGNVTWTFFLNKKKRHYHEMLLMTLFSTYFCTFFMNLYLNYITI